jgi:hypothetical protein
VTPADLRLRLLASIADQWAENDGAHAEFVFMDLPGRAEVGYIHGVAETRTATLRWLLTVPLATEPDPEPEPETHDRP